MRARGWLDQKSLMALMARIMGRVLERGVSCACAWAGGRSMRGEWDSVMM